MAGAALERDNNGSVDSSITGLTFLTVVQKFALTQASIARRHILDFLLAGIFTAYISEA